MQIISHRGYWLDAAEKNTPVAFERSFQLGFGTETDVRDRDGMAVIAHDMARRSDITLEEFLGIYGDCKLPLALNIKSDGLATALKSTLEKHGVENYFVFDAAVPDTRDHIRQGHPVFARLSEEEPVPAWSAQATGIWLDAFDVEWYGAETIQAILAQGRRVCVVSSELHQRNNEKQWQLLRHFADNPRVMLCTDLPVQARTYFGNH